MKVSLSKIRIDTFNELADLSKDFPLSPDEIRSHPWEGFAIGKNRAALATITESSQYPGYFHCRVCSGSASETKRPVAAELVGATIKNMLEYHDVSLKEFQWKAASNLASVPSQERKTSPSGEIVYFLRAGDFIKIGKATGSPSSRVSQLKTGCPFPIEVVATMPGGYAEERELHDRFQRIRAHGEWFHATPELCSYIEKLNEEVLA